jgi:hypothetical protein
VSASAVSAVSRNAICAGTVCTVFGDALKAGAVKAISGDAVEGAFCTISRKHVAGQAGGEQGSDQVLVHLGVLVSVGSVATGLMLRGCPTLEKRRRSIAIITAVDGK